MESEMDSPLLPNPWRAHSRVSRFSECRLFFHLVLSRFFHHVKGGCMPILSMCSRWWIKTTHEEYLLSWASRRQLWKIFLVPWALQNAMAIQFLGYNGHVLLRVSLALISVSLPKQKIWSDAVMVTCYLCPHLVDYAFIEGSDVSSIGYSSIILLFFLGVHSYAILLHCIILTSFNNANIVEFLIMFFLGCLVESRAAGIFWDLQESKQITEMLLDNATDGFCSVDCNTGIICSASPKLERTFACRPLEGRQFMDFVHRDQKTSSTKNLFDATSGIGNCRPRLLSCIQAHERRSFDAKFIPFMKAGQTVQLCLQVQGEMRVLYKEDSPPAAGSLASMPSLGHSDLTPEAGSREGGSRCSSVVTQKETSRVNTPDGSPAKQPPSSAIRQVSGGSSISNGRLGRLGQTSSFLKSTRSRQGDQGAPSEVSFTYSATDSLWTGYSPERRKYRRPSLGSSATLSRPPHFDVGVQTCVSAPELPFQDRHGMALDLLQFSSTGPVHKEDKEAQTYINWALDGFACNRCARPPVLPLSQSALRLPVSGVRRGRSPPRLRPPGIRALEIFPLQDMRKRFEEPSEHTPKQPSSGSAKSEEELPMFPPAPSASSAKKGGRRRLGRNVNAAGIQLEKSESQT